MTFDHDRAPHLNPLRLAVVRDARACARAADALPAVPDHLNVVAPLKRIWPFVPLVSTRNCARAKCV